MRWTAIVLAAVLVLAAGMGDAQAPPVKLALVIGNADYDGDGRIDASAAGVASSESRGFVPDLRNPLNDAGDIRDSLTRVGFRVDHVVNADGATMSGALAAFGTKVAAAPDTAQVVVYYAGHAIQVDGANFLIPVGARLPAADFANMPTNQVQTILRRVAVSTAEITEQLKQLRAPGVNLLMFDACRNNPWETRVRGLGRSVGATRGLAEIAAPPRTVIAFSTAPGRTADDGAGRNSPFAGVLKTWVTRPGTVLQMLDGVGGEVQAATGGRQTPWFQSASVGQACLASCLREPSIAPSDTERQLREARDRIAALEAAQRAQTAANAPLVESRPANPNAPIRTGDQTQTSSGRAMASALSTFRSAYVQAIRLSTGEYNQQAAVSILAAAGRPTTSVAVVGAYVCTLYETMGSRENYRDPNARRQYNAFAQGSFSCRVTSVAGQLRIQKLSGDQVFDEVLRNLGDGYFAFDSSYVSSSRRTWLLEAIDGGRLRASGFDEKIVSSSIDTNFAMLVLTRR